MLLLYYTVNSPFLTCPHMHINVHITTYVSKFPSGITLAFSQYSSLMNNYVSSEFFQFLLSENTFVVPSVLKDLSASSSVTTDLFLSVQCSHHLLGLMVLTALIAIKRLAFSLPVHFGEIMCLSLWLTLVFLLCAWCSSV